MKKVIYLHLHVFAKFLRSVTSQTHSCERVPASGPVTCQAQVVRFLAAQEGQDCRHQQTLPASCVLVLCTLIGFIFRMRMGVRVRIRKIIRIKIRQSF